MAVLEVRRPGRDKSTVRVSRRKPVAVGSHEASDVQVDGVEALYCRIAWNGEAYEAVAAGEEDLSINGQPTRQRVLADGDKLRCGEVVLKMHRGSRSSSTPKADSRKRRESGEASDSAPADDGPSVAAAAFEEGDAEQADAFVAAGGPSMPPLRRSVDEADAAIPPPRGEELPGLDGVGADGDEPDPVREVLHDPLKDRVRRKMRASARRPGQHDTLRSPLLYAMAAGVVLLVVATLVLSLFIRGQSIEQQFADAKATAEAGRYAEADSQLTEFIADHGGHAMAEPARRLRALTRIDRQIRGASPDWSEGLSALDSTVASFRDDEDFATLYPDLAERGGLIALGAATDAGRRRDERLLTLSERGEATLTKYSPDAVPPRALLDKIAAARRESRETMIRMDVRDEFLGRMKEADAGDRPLAVIDAYRGMVQADAKLASDKETRNLNEAARAALVKAARATEFEPANAPVDAADDWTVRTIAVVDRPAGDAPRDDVIAAVWADETLFGVDRASGDPVWSRPLPGSFPPVAVEVPDRGRLSFDARGGVLTLVSDESGEPLRTLALGPDARPLRPTVEGATAFVPVGTTLLRVSLTDMRVTAAMRFGQSLLAEPAYVRSEPPSVLVLGDEQMAYLLDAATLELRDTLVQGHDRGSVIAPPLAAAEFAVLAVNAADAGATLTLLSVVDGRLAVADRLSLSGPVVDPPVIRGRDLYVATADESVAVVAVRDEDGGRLAAGPGFSAGEVADDGTPPTGRSSPSTAPTARGRRRCAASVTEGTGTKRPSSWPQCGSP